ncbi:MAG: metal ABC transporter substrate-binding protein [Rhodobacteraceae bacterium]|nr:metal ABC transporter substrate-binding protein [Paracoccaceae bacterium]MAY45379.1 metal ABC transporter substrate-binding protein [Paracoccaceae bacterium]
MTTRRTLLHAATALVALTLAMPAAARADTPMPVVATFSILGDMVKTIGGDHVAVTTLVGPDGDAHVYQPTPADARAVSAADILFVNGLQFEGWIDRLIDASGFHGTQVVSTRGIDPIAFDPGGEHDNGEDDHDDHAEENGHHHHAGVDPHAWQSIANALVYVDNITAALAQADPENATVYYMNRAEYVARLKDLDAHIHDLVASLPKDRRTIVTSHDAFGYFAQAYGLTFLAPQGMSTESEPSAQDVAHMITQIRDNNIAAIFVENITDTRLLDQIALETGTTIGGTLYSDSLSGEHGPASTYLDMMGYNAATLARALQS